MPTKPGLTRLEHEALRISQQLETAYPKLSPVARLSSKTVQAVDWLRSALDRQVFLDYCQWDTQEKAQFKGARTYYLGDTRIAD